MQRLNHLVMPRDDCLRLCPLPNGTILGSSRPISTGAGPFHDDHSVDSLVACVGHLCTLRACPGHRTQDGPNLTLTLLANSKAFSFSSLRCGKA